MSEAYAGKTDAQIIEENAADLNSKDNYQTKDSYNPRGTVTEEQSNVNEAGLEKFPGAEVSVGRSGMSGGGTNPQNIPPEEGGQGRSQTQGESSERFEGVGGPEDKKFEALANNPGGFEARPRGIDQSYTSDKKEPVPQTTGQELQPGQGVVSDQAGGGIKEDPTRDARGY